MKLTPDQIQTVRQWAETGATLNDIQRQLKTELGVGCTYMDLRLGLIELGITIADKPRSPDPAPPAPPAPPAAVPDAMAEDTAADDFAAEASPGGGNVTITLDELQVPGMMASGKVTFSDGQTAQWYMDQMGRLGMRAPQPGYQPPPADIENFQMQLDRVLTQAGF